MGDVTVAPRWMLNKNLTGKVFASYAVITPETANLPEDVLRAIPVQGVANSLTGDAPKSWWQQLAAAVTNLAVSAVNFVVNTVVGLANLLAHAPEIIQHYALALWNTAVNTVKTAVNAVKKVVDAAVEWIKGEVASIVNNYIQPLLNELKEGMVNLVTGELQSIKDGAKDNYYLTHIIPTIMLVGVAMFGLATAIGYLLDSMPLAGAVALGVLSAVLVGSITAVAMENGYYNKGKNVAHNSESEIETELKNFRNSYGTAAYFFHGFFNFLPVAFEKYFMGGSDFDIVYTIGTFYFGLLSGLAFMAMKPTPTTGMLMTIPLAFDFAAIAGGILDFTKIPNLISKYGLGAGIALTVVLIDLIACATIFVISDLGYIYSAFGGD